MISQQLRSILLCKHAFQIQLWEKLSFLSPFSYANNLPSFLSFRRHCEVAVSLAAFYQQITIGHVEAGLRTWNKYSPFPEEMNRQLTDVLSDLYFVPTRSGKKNLLLENHKENKIFITGNTVIDALQYTLKEDYHHPILDEVNTKHKKMILLTMHRREN